MPKKADWLEPIKIEKGIPYPEPKQLNPLTDAAKSMEVGDSILIPYNRDIPYTYNMHRATGFTFIQKKEGDKLRIWRIK